jgi:vacuolar-type H+-ATPase subunit I/STV1
VERLGGEIASFLVKIGGIIALVLGVLDILKGIVLLVLANVIGSFLGSILPGLGWLLNLIPIGGSILSAVYIVAGAVIAAVGYTLVKMPVPPTAEEKSRWVLILAVLAALALAFGSYATLLALALALAGLLLAPTVKPTAPPPLSGPVKVQPS